MLANQAIDEACCWWNCATLWGILSVIGHCQYLCYFQSVLSASYDAVYLASRMNDYHFIVIHCVNVVILVNVQQMPCCTDISLLQALVFADWWVLACFVSVLCLVQVHGTMSLQSRRKSACVFIYFRLKCTVMVRICSFLSGLLSLHHSTLHKVHSANSVYKTFHRCCSPYICTFFRNSWSFIVDYFQLDTLHSPSSWVLLH